MGKITSAIDYIAKVDVIDALSGQKTIVLIRTGSAH